jgi:hypothetical protein
MFKKSHHRSPKARTSQILSSLAKDRRLFVCNRIPSLNLAKNLARSVFPSLVRIGGKKRGRRTLCALHVTENLLCFFFAMVEMAWQQVRSSVYTERTLQLLLTTFSAKVEVYSGVDQPVLRLSAIVTFLQLA